MPRCPPIRANDSRLYLKNFSLAAVLVAVIVLGGACMDPSGAFQGAFLLGDWENHLEVYWSAGLTGAAFSGYALHLVTQYSLTKSGTKEKRQ